MMLEKPLIIFKAVILFFFLISFSYAELLKPNSTISPKEVIKIQLSGLQQNDLEYKDSGIEQTWKFAHPNNKRVTGPLSNFKMMIKSDSYGMMINHLSHTITELGILLIIVTLLTLILPIVFVFIINNSKYKTTE